MPEGVIPKLVLGLGRPDETIVLTEVTEKGTSYYRDEAGTHFVPKRSLDDILL